MELDPSTSTPVVPKKDCHSIDAWGIPDMHLKSGPYRARFARTRADLQAVQRLRFQVFNLELGEGLATSYATGLDEDPYDRRCHHLLVEHQDSREVVGTYRLMTRTMAANTGFYSESEFHLETLPQQFLREGVELGRACVASGHRGGRVIYLLWRGIAQYMSWNKLRYLFGCCSVPATDPGVGLRLHRQLAAGGHLIRGFQSPATQSCSCRGSRMVDRDVELPPLFRIYLDMGAKVCSEPAIDREFGVVDFLIVLDVDKLCDRTKKRMFGSLSSESRSVATAASAA